MGLDRSHPLGTGRDATARVTGMERDPLSGAVNVGSRARALRAANLQGFRAFGLARLAPLTDQRAGPIGPT